MRRRTLALAGLLCLVALAGCSFGAQEVSEGSLDGNATYDWTAETNVSLNVTGGNYQAVYDLGNDSYLRVFSRDALGSSQPRNVWALRYRFPNGTVVTANHSGLGARRTSDRLNITAPASGGQLAFTADQTGKGFSTPVFREGSYRLILPHGARVGIPFLSQVNPNGWSRSIENGRVVLTWEDVTGSSVHAQWFLERDFYIFGGLLALAILLGIGGTVYYLRQIRRLERVREEIGLDVDHEDDDLGDDGPPPGMG